MQKFEGADRGRYCDGDLQRGLYFGQLLDGVRDGYGTVCCTDIFGNPWLYECEWRQGSPVQGRYVKIQWHKWYQHEGTLDKHYVLTGTGSFTRDDGYSYKGQWRQGKKHG